MVSQPQQSAPPPIPDKHTKLLLSPLPTPAIKTGGTFTIISEVHISSTALQCLNTTLTPSTYSKWNTFCPYVEINSQQSGAESLLPEHDGDNIKIGTEFTMTIYMDRQGPGKIPLAKPASEAPGSRAQKGVVSVLEEAQINGRSGYRLAWQGKGFPGFLLRSERVQEFVDDGRGGCEYRTWETFAGLLSHVVKWYVGNRLIHAFEDWAMGLKVFLEKKEVPVATVDVDDSP